MLQSTPKINLRNEIYAAYLVNVLPQPKPNPINMYTSI